MTFLLVTALVSAASLKSELGLGGDYTNQHYTALALDTLLQTQDTLTFDTEGRGLLNLSLNLNSPHTQLDATNGLSLSTRSIHDLLNLELEQELLRPLKLQGDYTGEMRYYHNALPLLSDTSFRNDYLDQAGWLTLKYVLADRLDLAAGTGLEYLHYPQPDSFSSDYLMGRMRASGSFDLGELSSLDANYEWSRRWTPATSMTATDSQDYQNHDLRLSANSYLGANWRLLLDNGLSRRTYLAPGRSYWEENPAVTLAWDLSDKFTLELANDTRLTWYDTVTLVYRNQFLSALKPSLEFKPALEWALRCGPQWDFPAAPLVRRIIPGTSQRFPLTSDDYVESALWAGLEYLKSSKLWISLEDRLGRRRYPLADSSYQSDYRFNDLSFTVDWTVVPTPGGGLALEASASVTPEWHDEPTDNTTTNTFTFDLKYGF
jgi:hypothetical protein